jgi:hypothetical protein
VGVVFVFFIFVTTFLLAAALDHGRHHVVADVDESK